MKRYSASISAGVLALALPLAASCQEATGATANAPTGNSSPSTEAQTASGSGSAGGSPERPALPPTLSYHVLMRLTWQARSDLLDRYPALPRGRFLDSLPGPKRAVVMTDPEDCTSQARLRRMAFANGKQDPGAVANTVQDVAHSAVVGVANTVFGGLGSLLSGAAKVNELRKTVAYKDICDVSAEERVALLNPGPDSEVTGAESSKSDDTALDKASRFLAR